MFKPSFITTISLGCIEFLNLNLIKNGIRNVNNNIIILAILEHSILKW